MRCYNSESTASISTKLLYSDGLWCCFGFISPKIKYVRQEREGFIRGRVKGIQLATSETFTVMESHAEVCKGWLEPLLWEVQVNPKTMANPVIVQIHFHSFAFLNPVYQMMDYNYLFEMKWGTLTGEKARTKTYKPYNLFPD